MNKKYRLNEDVNNEMDKFNREQALKYPSSDILKIDLHCHDYNSDEPDELIGRILNLPETWIKSEELIGSLVKHGCDTFTITNHNNARSCYEMQDKGKDILTGAEFSCTVPDYDVRIHVLAYGFSPQQESKLLKYKNDIYRFQAYALENDIPTVWAHPLYHYRKGEHPTMEFFDKMSLVFQRYEVLNGQRDTWQNMLVKTWIESLNEETIRKYEKKFCINAGDFCTRPYERVMCGGSDAHMGIFAGLTGTRLYVENLQERLKDTSRSSLALEALRLGNTAPFGGTNNSEKMAVAFIDYFCQIGMNMKDPGLFRLLLHKGESRDKLASFLILNGISELQRHKLTLNFLKVFHSCLNGKEPGYGKKLLVKKDYKPVFKEAISIARARNNNPEEMSRLFDESIKNIYRKLTDLSFKRLNKKIDHIKSRGSGIFESADIEDFIDRFEIPGHARNLFGRNGTAGTSKEGRRKGKPMSDVNMSDFLDGLTFPFLASSVILAADFVSTKVLYQARTMLSGFSKRLGRFEHPQRMLWLTDTFDDKNGVSMSLRHMLKEIQSRDLPIDLLICSNTVEPEDHLIVLKPLSEYVPAFYKDQPMRIPDVMEIHRLFKEGEYDRILCSTEGPMGAVALFLKNAYSVPAAFYVHTDWLSYMKSSLNFSDSALSRARRMLRAFYGSFDKLIVLNREQKKWFSGEDMGMKKKNVKLTAHWVDEKFRKHPQKKKELFGIEENSPVLLYVGRLSEEKGVRELEYIHEKVSAKVPGVRLVIAGKGPDSERLKKNIPDAVFLGWVGQDELPGIYSSADMLILPSKFDTFGNVIIEAFSCGCPVISYNTKGPRDIIENDKSGYLVSSMKKMPEKISAYMNDKGVMAAMKANALERAKNYDVDAIVEKFMEDMDLASDE